MFTWTPFDEPTPPGVFTVTGLFVLVIVLVIVAAVVLIVTLVRRHSRNVSASVLAPSKDDLGGGTT